MQQQMGLQRDSIQPRIDIVAEFQFVGWTWIEGIQFHMIFTVKFQVISIDQTFIWFQFQTFKPILHFKMTDKPWVEEAMTKKRALQNASSNWRYAVSVPLAWW